jgi:hypothetical protein
VRISFQTLREHQQYVKISKYELLLQEVRILRYSVSRDGIAVDSSKVEAVVDWQAPTTVTEICSFWGWPVITGRL